MKNTAIVTLMLLLMVIGVPLSARAQTYGACREPATVPVKCAVTQIAQGFRTESDYKACKLAVGRYVAALEKWSLCIESLSEKMERDIESDLARKWRNSDDDVRRR